MQCLRGSNSASKQVAFEPDVFPTFYYNDLLVSNIGDGIGLNLFEPRYKEMCRRMQSDPRFLFMPNYEDYICRAGDVGFVIKVTELTGDRRGSYGIRGTAVDLVVVECTWMEPETRGLSYAKVSSLDPRVDCISSREVEVLLDEAIASGWDLVGGGHKALLRPPSAKDGELVLGLNWQQQAFLTVRAGDPAPVIEHLQQLWQTSMSNGQNSRMPHMVPRVGSISKVLHQIPGPVASVPLTKACWALLDKLKIDGPGMLSQVGIPEGDPDTRTWCTLLSEVRISGVYEMPVSLPPARVGLRRPPEQGYKEHCFPTMVTFEEPNDDEVIAFVTNGTNVKFYTSLSNVTVTKESMDAAVSRLGWHLNWPRLQLILRAREARQGPLAELPDDATRLVCKFLAVSDAAHKAPQHMAWVQSR